MSKKELVEVTIKVPKRLLDVIEAENYFGWNKEDFFTAGIIRSIDIELHDLDWEHEDKLRKKYGKNIGTVYIEEDETTKLRKLHC